MKFHIALGTYASAEEQGIQILEFDTVSGRLKRVGGTSGVDSPSFVTFDAPRRRLFSVSEDVADGSVVSFRYVDETARDGELYRDDETAADDERPAQTETAALVEVNRQKTRGGAPCYLSVDESGKWLLGVNYMSGSVFVFPVNEDASIGSMTEHIQHTGHGARADRQEGPHTHSIANIPGSDYWMVQDLGTDEIYVYELDRAQGRLQQRHVVSVEGGCGARHVSFHPNLPIVYVVQELSSTITTFAYDRGSGGLERISPDISMLPADFDGENTGADIHVAASGKFLYASNRGHDSLVVLRILEDGRLRVVGHSHTMGRTPRNFVIVQGTPFVLVANQGSNSVVVMQSGEDGIPVSTGEVYVADRPVCLKMLA